MTKPYDQHCPIATALDVVGEHWSLLVVRELMLGPLRFGEIAHGLPGVGSRQLTERLKSLVERDVVQTFSPSTLGGPAGYGLTPRGRALAPSLSALAAWGVPLLKASSPSHPPSPTSLVLTMLAKAGNRTSGYRGAACLSLGDQSFSFVFGECDVSAARGDGPSAAQVGIGITLQGAAALLEQPLSVPRAVRRHKVVMSGAAAGDVLKALFALPDEEG